MTATIKIYPNKLDDHLYEECLAKSGQTFEQWLFANVPSYYASDEPLFSVLYNGQYLHHSKWEKTVLQPSDQLEITIEAKDPATIVAVIVAVVAVAVSIYTMNQIPDSYNNTTPDGSTIYGANVQGNRPRLMGVIPEIAGRHKVFPDFLTMPHRQYIDNEQWIYLMMSIGVGDYDINASEIYIGNTPIANYSGDMTHTIYGPGVTSNVNDAAQNVFTSGEVGSTTGTSGLELKGNIVSSGSGFGGGSHFTFVAAKIYAYAYIVEGADTWYESVPIFYNVGDIIEITNAGSQNGTYKVISKDNYNSITVQEVDANGDPTSWTQFTSATKITATLASLNGGGDGEFMGPFMACPENELTEKLELDFFFPQGLGKLDDDGDYVSQSVTIRVEYRAEGAPTYSSVEYTFTGSSGDQVGETKTISIATAARMEVRVKRLTEGYDNTRIKDKVEWTALKAHLETPTSYDETTTIAIKIKGTNSLSSSAENKFNLIATRKLPVYTGGSWEGSQATKDLAPFFAHVVKDCGHTDLQLDLPELDALHTIWNTRADEFNGVFDTDSTLFAVLKRVLDPGYAEPTLDYGQIIPIRDEPRTVFEHMYQPQNMLSPGLERTIKFIDADEPDGVEVEYFSNTTWKPETIMCLLPGDLGLNPLKVRAFGITDKTRAWRYGMRKRRIKRYRRTQYSFKTEMDALNSRYLSYCALADDIPGYSQNGLVENTNGRAIEVDQPLVWGSGTHYIAIRKPDGKLSGPYIATQGEDDYQVIIDVDLDFVPLFNGRQEPPLFMFGEATKWRHEALVTTISPQGTDKVSVKAVNYAPEVYLDDDNSPP